jgi:tetratricopeptide (TPR) repeat protein
MNKDSHHRSTRERLARFGLLLVVVVSLVGGVIWWQDRPLAKAEALLQADDPKAALQTLDAFLSRHPDHRRAMLLKAQSLVALHDWDAADKIFAQTGVGTAAESRAWASALLHQQQWSEALTLLNSLSANSRTDAESLRDLAICQFQTGQPAQALATTTELASLPGHAIDGFFQRGVIHRAMGNAYLAIKDWERIEALAPDANGLPISPAEFFRVHAEDLMSGGRPRRAITYFERSSELRLTAEICAQLGEALYLTGQKAAAERSWRRALERDDKCYEALMGLAELALARNDADAAIQFLKPIAIEQNATEESAYLMQRAHTRLRHEEIAADWEQRVATLRRSSKLQAAFEMRADAATR